MAVLEKKVILIALVFCANFYGISGLGFTNPGPGVEVDPVDKKLLLVKETATNGAGTPFLRIADFQCTTGDTCTITISDVEPSVGFQIDDQSLTLNEQLDFDDKTLCPQTTFCLISLQVTENGGGAMPFTVRLLDENDESPEVLGALCRVSIDEKKGKADVDPICTIQAEDRDALDTELFFDFGESQVLFELVRANEYAFNLIFKEGAELDYETDAVHSFPVIVTDKVGNDVSTEVTINVIDVADMPPRWNKLTRFTELLETDESTSFPIEIPQIEILATDGDSGTCCKYPIEYTFEPADYPDKEYFTINKDTGIVSLQAKLNTFDLQNARGSLGFTFTVKAQEIGVNGEAITEEISITVVDTNNMEVFVSENDNAGPWEKTLDLRFDIDETQNAGFVVGSFFARDEDTDRANNRYKATWSDDVEWFKEAIELRSSKCQNCEDEMTGEGLTEYTFVVKDKSKIDFDQSAEWQANEQDGFQINVVLTDDHDVPLPGATVTLTFRVIDKNDEIPVFEEKQYIVDVPEDSDVGKDIAVVKATDKDIKEGFNKLTYTFSDDPKPDHLSLDPNTGIVQIKTEKPFDYEQVKLQRYTVRVEDGEDRNPPVEAQFIINVGNINDEQPTIRINPSRLTINEKDRDAAFEVPPVIIVDDRDTPTKDHLTCEIVLVDQYPEKLKAEISTWFIVETNCKSLTPNPTANIDREVALKNLGLYELEETIDRLTFTVTVTDPLTDPGYPDSEVVEITIVIQDENDEQPQFETPTEDLWIYETTASDIGEEDPGRRKIMDVVATDWDKDTTFCFETAPDNTIPVEFDLNEDNQACSRTGKIALRREIGGDIDREKAGGDSIQIKIRVSDNKNPFVEKTYVVEVIDRNDNKPEIESPPNNYEVRVQENWNTDPDFCDDETPQELAVSFKAKDQDNCDAGDKGLKYGCIDFTLAFGALKDSRFEIITDEALDPEGYTTAKLLTFGCGIDREASSNFDLQVHAYDDFRPGNGEQQPGQNEMRTLKIIVTDVNDNDPMFSDPSLAPIPEHADKTAKVVGTITITDKDEGANADVTARVTSVTKDEGEDPVLPIPFVIEPSSESPGSLFELKTNPAFDFTFAYGIYNVTIEAQDGGEGDHVIEACYEVEVEDINNKPPVMDPYAGDKFPIPERQQIGMPVMYIDDNKQTHNLPPFKATDDDKPDTPNSAITYDFVLGLEDDPNRLFYWVNDVLYTKAVWDWELEEKKTCQVCVYAQDQGEEPLRSQETVCINLTLTSNGKPPVFNDPPQEYTIEENFLTTQNFPAAIDGDYPPEPIYYYLVGFGEQTVNFSIPDPTKPTLRVEPTLDRESFDQLKLVVFASNQAGLDPPVFDNEDDPRLEDRSYLRISIDVEDVNDVAPKFAAPIFYAGVSVRYDSNVVLDNTTIKAYDPDLNDTITYRFGSTVEKFGTGLENLPANPFLLEQGDAEDGFGAILRRDFVVDSKMQGRFEFKLDAVDSVENFTSVDVKVYIVPDEYITQFNFNNEGSLIRQLKNEVEQIFSDAYGYQCTINKIDQPTENTTVVDAHFVDTVRNEQVLKSIIEGWKYENQVKLAELRSKLYNLGVILNMETERQSAPVDPEKILIYALIAGCAVLAVGLLVITASCFFRNRGLNLKIRALAAQADPPSGNGMKQGLEALPNTNAFQLNPMWSEDNEGKKIPSFDVESVRSGDSVLYGVENDDDFKGHRDDDRINPDFENEFQSEDEDEGSNNYNSIRNPQYNQAYDGAAMEGVDNTYEYPATTGNPMGTISRRNPLLDLEDDTEA